MSKSNWLHKYKNTAGGKSFIDFGGMPLFDKMITVKRSAVTIGIDLGLYHVKLLKTVKLSNNTWKVLGWKCISFSSQNGRGTSAFENTLKSELNNLCGTESSPNIWVNMSSAYVNIRNFEIPSVPRKHIENAVYWAAKKELVYDEKECILDFEVRGAVRRDEAYRLPVVAYSVPHRDVDEVRSLFSRIGIPLSGLTIVPFSLQNIFRTGWIRNPESVIAHLFIGNDFSRIDIFSQNDLVLSRNIKAGIKSNVDAVLDDIKSRQDSADVPAEGDIRADEGNVRKLISSLGSESVPLGSHEFGFGLDGKEIFEMMLPALKRLIKQVEITFEYYGKNTAGPAVEKIYLSGIINLSGQIAGYISEQCGIKAVILDPLSSVIPCGEDKANKNCVSDRIALMPALGVALSAPDRTPNILYTYKEKSQDLFVNRVSRIVFSAFFISFVICIGFWAVLGGGNARKKAAVERIERQLAEYSPRLSKEMIDVMVLKIKNSQPLSKQYAERYLGLAVMQAMSAALPEQINIISVNANFGAVSLEPKGGSPNTNNIIVKERRGEEKRMVVSGIVVGERGNLEAILLDYAMKLRLSPMFRKVDVDKTRFVPFSKEFALQFALTIEIGT